MKDKKRLAGCVHCGGVLVRRTAPLLVDRAGYHVHWDAVPAWICRQCGEAAFEGAAVEALQAALATLDQQTEQLASV